MARQYTGSASKVTNCQIGVFAAYVSCHGHAFVDRALSLPKSWTDAPARLAAAHAPNDMSIAAGMIKRALAADMPFAWVAAEIGLPGLNGRQLADAARVSRPELRVLFLTGYAPNAAIGNGAVLGVGTEMLTRPFALDALSANIRALIENEWTSSYLKAQREQRHKLS